VLEVWTVVSLKDGRATSITKEVLTGYPWTTGLLLRSASERRVASTFWPSETPNVLLTLRSA